MSDYERGVRDAIELINDNEGTKYSARDVLNALTIRELARILGGE